MIERERISPHPLDGCDDEECYKVLMAERTVLVAAQREAQDNLVKTVIQLSSALIALTAGFVTQAKIIISGFSLFLFILSICGLSVAVMSGLTENFFSSRAYKEQQTMLEDYYGRFITEFSEPPSNKKVRLAQLSAFLFFGAALIGLSSFAVVQTKGKGDVEKSSASSATAAPSAAALPSSVPAPGALRRQSIRFCNEVGCTEYATSASQEEVAR